MQTPASVYEPSPRQYPSRVPEPQYRVYAVHRKGQFRWKKQDVFLTEVLWGERVGLLPRDERWFTLYFAQWPIADFDSRHLRVLPRRQPLGFDMDKAGEEEVSPSPAPHPLSSGEEKVSGMCPV